MLYYLNIYTGWRCWESNGEAKASFATPDEHHVAAVTLLVVPSVTNTKGNLGVFTQAAINTTGLQLHVWSVVAGVFCSNFFQTWRPRKTMSYVPAMVLFQCLGSSPGQIQAGTPMGRKLYEVWLFFQSTWSFKRITWNITTNCPSNLRFIQCSLNSKYGLLLTPNNVILVFCNNFLISYGLIQLAW